MLAKQALPRIANGKHEFLGGSGMNDLVYLVYPIMIILLLWGSKLCGRGVWNEEAFSLRQMKALQGFFAICIMLHHIGQKTCASWLDPKLIEPGLELFVPYGYYFVGFFLFCSGYGLYQSYRTKPDYLTGFCKRRILPLVLSYYSTGLLFLLARFLMKEQLDGLKIFYYVSGLKLSNPNAWFVIALPFFYLAFYLAFRHCKSEKNAVISVLAFTLGYDLLGTLIDHNDFWMRGEWWYNSVHFFVIGILFARHKEAITAHLKKHYLLYFMLFFVGLFVLDALSNMAQGTFSYYGENWHAPDKVFRRWVCLLSQILASCSFVFFVFLLGMKVLIGNRFLAFMGTITLEFYLIHGLFLELFAYNFAGVVPSLYHLRNVPLLILIVFLPSLPAALLLKKWDHFLADLLCGKRKHRTEQKG
jgi:peptidoglycan/LPS O-acetylase OafA/YrhL